MQNNFFTVKIIRLSFDYLDIYMYKATVKNGNPCQTAAKIVSAPLHTVMSRFSDGSVINQSTEEVAWTRLKILIVMENVVGIN